MNIQRNDPIFVRCSTCLHPASHITTRTREPRFNNMPEREYKVLCENCEHEWIQILVIPTIPNNPTNIDIEE